jgi:hypothetical protein
MGRPPALCAILVIAACRPAARDAPPPSNHDASPTRLHHNTNTHDVLGLAMGATWHFHGTVTTWDAATGKDSTRAITWTTTIVSVDEEDSRTSYQVLGWPTAVRDQVQTPIEIVVDHGVVSIGDEKWLAWPPTDGAEQCDDAYCWVVSASGKGWDVTYRTSPDVTTYHLEPGRGVTSFSYHHNGTTDEIVLERD